MTYAITPTADMHLDSPIETQHWRPLVNWLLAVPHLVIANALGNLANILSIISWFSIVFTGRMPDGIARFQCMILRYEARAYSYVAFLRRPYPVFEFDMTNSDPSSDPLRVDFAPQLLDRNRLTVAFRLILIIPAVLYTMVIAIAAFVAVVAAALAVIVTGRWPRGLRSFVIDAGRLTLRVSAYGRLLTDTYPSLTLASTKHA
ncbi:MAG: hypothetical protein JWN62_2992 [Acidimicrobiales bacterium]|nr:hypothetical protein [Acidimicrobiales bacterium]